MATEKRERKDNIVTGHLPLLLSKVQRFAARSATHFFLIVTHAQTINQNVHVPVQHKSNWHYAAAADITVISFPRETLL